jgi:hypothetical protein
LDWWEHILGEPDFGARQHNVLATLVATWGDGSGTGTGGTLQTHTTTGSSSQMEMWMGVWSHAVHSSTSNWKELRTLLETIRRERLSSRFRGVMLLYFTDNMVTYELINRGSSSSPRITRPFAGNQVLGNLPSVPSYCYSCSWGFNDSTG